MSARRLAAVDIGTNTLLLLIVEAGGGGTSALRDECRFGRLGQGLDRSGRLAGEAVERSLAILREYRQAMDDANVDALVAIGTQALREAQNAADFVSPAEAILGAPIEVVNGEREAALVYRSVADGFPGLAAGDLVVADVGGGSTEIIAGHGGQVRSLISLPIGAVRLSERHLHTDPATPDETRALLADIDQHLSRLDPDIRGALVGTAGTATTLAAVEQKLRRYDAGRVQGFRLSRASIERQLARFLELTVAEKRRMPGVEPQRADVIAAGAAIYARLAVRLGAAEMVTSDRGVRWGAVLELAQRG